MLGASTVANIILAAALLPGMFGLNFRHLRAMEYQAAMSAQYTCIIENGFDYVGNDITSVQAPIDQCCGRCIGTAYCNAWSWTNQNGGTCYLKTGRGQVVVNPNVKSAVLLNSPPPTCPLIYDVDFPGNDLARVGAPKAEDCCDICKNTLGCRAYTWSDYQGGSCWLKSKSSPGVAKPGAKSAEAYSITESCKPTLEANVDFVGFDMANRASSTPEGCCGICQSLPTCRAYSWTNQNSGTCWLKSAVGERVAKQGVTSAAILPNPEPPCQIEDGVDYVGNDIANVRAASAKDCCYICQGRASSGCKAFSWSDYQGGTCWLKSGKGATAQKAGVKSATAL